MTDAPNSDTVRFFTSATSRPSAFYSQMALVPRSMRLVFIGAELVRGDSASAVRAAFERVKRIAEKLGAKLTDVVMSNNYVASSAGLDRLRSVRPEYFGRTVPAATGLPFAGHDAPNPPAAIELVVAVKP